MIESLLDRTESSTYTHPTLGWTVRNKLLTSSMALQVGSVRYVWAVYGFLDSSIVTQRN